MTETFVAPGPFPPSPRRAGFSPTRAVIGLLGGLAWLGALVIGTALAVVVAFSLVVVAAISSVVLAFVLAASKARQTARARRDGDEGVIEARSIGGHSWVAYGWDGERQVP
ncbi:MAG: hypothetical protein KGL69_09685 [Alphaproteobacteria bacterium]|jgi:hypothetical protein|nr:hypothetical protein [Alphaproteobacteria bacterium]